MPDNPIDTLTDYYGAYNNHKGGEMADLAEHIEKLNVENGYLQKEIEETEALIQEKKLEKEQAELAKKLAEEEEARKKAGKGGPAKGLTTNASVAGGLAAKKK
jgi:CHASE3 domain sensor protein